MGSQEIWRSHRAEPTTETIKLLEIKHPARPPEDSFLVSSLLRPQQSWSGIDVDNVIFENIDADRCARRLGLQLRL